MLRSKKCHLYSYSRKAARKLFQKNYRLLSMEESQIFLTKSALLSVGTRQVLFFFAKPLISTRMLFVINNLRYRDAV